MTKTACNKKFDVEVAFIQNGTIEEWDTDCVQDYIEALSAEEAISLARDYVCDCIIENGENPAEHDFVLRAAEFCNGERGEWIYES